MHRFRNILYQTGLLYAICVCLINSCAQKNSKQPIATGKSSQLKSPVTIAVKNPVIVNLDTCPPPLSISIPEKKADSFVLTTKDFKKVIHAPEIIPADFFVPVETYRTSNGLPFNAVASSYVDRKGNLWFGMQGGGVSRYDGKSFMNYSMSHGLPSNNVISILEDTSDNLWFGTLSGVSCYNGKSFTNYTTAQGLSGNEVRSILQDKNGNLWFGTKNGISKLPAGNYMSHEKASFTNYSIAEGLAGNIVSCILEDKNGDIWFGTKDGGLSRYNGKSFINYSTAQGLINNVVSSIAEDKNHDLWIGTQNGISFYNGKTFTNYTTAQGLAGNNVLSILKDKSGNIWFGTATGASLFDEKSLPVGKTAFINYTTLNGLPNNRITSIAEDKSGNTWFTSTDGVFRLDRDWRFLPGNKTGFTSYRLTQEVATNSVTSILEDSKKNLWFGTLGAGVFRLNPDEKTFTTYTTAQGLPNDVVQNIAEDRKGNLWFVTNSGISRLDKDWKYFTTYTTAQGLLNETGTGMAEDKSGNLWFGTRGGGVSMLNKDWKTFTTYTTAQGLAHNTVRSLIEDKEGNIWFGTLGGGLSELDKDCKHFTNYTTANGLITDYVWNVFEDNNENIWLGTEAGLIRFDKKTFTIYTTAQGLGDNVIGDILLNKKGAIWMGTNNGLAVLKKFVQTAKNTSANTDVPASNSLPNDGLSAALNPVFEVYNVKTGYPLNDINVNGLCLTTGDIIWAGTSDKLVRFDYNSLYKNPNQPNVSIQHIKINNENISWYDIKGGKEEIDSLTISPHITEEISLFGKVFNETQLDTFRKKFGDIKFDSISSFYPLPVNLVLPYQFNNVTFDFAAIEPAKPQLVKYQYMLKGYDNDWNPITDQTTAAFGNIREGNYTFKLKAQSPDGVWSAPLIYSFKVLAPWYRTWWAYTLYTLAILTAAFIFFKWRVRKLNKEKRVLEERVALRTTQLKDEKQKVESTLQELKATQAQLIQQEKMASLGELTAGIAHEIQNPLNFVNNFSEVSNELINEMKEELSKGNYEDANMIADDVKQNLEKINHHGKRADAIVKGMMQHSRQTKGVKEATDINALCDEYLRLSYHGLRAKDKEFNADFKVDFDGTIGKINVVPQDIGRVLLNLFNNAFYAVNEKRRVSNKVYQPAVSVQTKKLNGKSGSYLIEIKVTDNGNGIPQNIVDKIFQPFFTTKPTGQGTGLGLSLAYDIITKEHDGQLRVVTKEGEGAEFVIQLPIVP